MSSIAIVGGHGQVAQHIIDALVRAGHTPVALVRKEEQRGALEAKGAEVRILDIEHEEVDGFVRAFEGCDAVVFAAGGGGDGNLDRKRTVDFEGSTKSVEAAGDAGIRRFVQISAIDVDAELPADTPEVWRAYVAAKADSDKVLRESNLDWTIIRPGMLTDDLATDAVSFSPDASRGPIPRADVAATVVACLEEPGTIGHQANLVSGKHTVADAVRTLIS